MRLLRAFKLGNWGLSCGLCVSLAALSCSSGSTTGAGGTGGAAGAGGASVGTAGAGGTSASDGAAGTGPGGAGGDAGESPSDAGAADSPVVDASGRDSSELPARTPVPYDATTPDGSFLYPELTTNVTLHVAGDSTAAIFPATDATHRVGWAAVLQPFFGTGVTVNDQAASGRSTKSFINEGRWANMKTALKPGDYVFIEFGHNDEKPDESLGTNAATTFRTNLKIYIYDTRAAGAYPVLLTPISRRKFDGTTVTPTHGNYPAAVIAVGQETGTPVIDMTEKTRVWLEGLGPMASIAYFADIGDNTHLSAMGAPEVAKLAVQGIRELNMPIADRLAK